jgi:hypothetical protein
LDRGQGRVNNQKSVSTHLSIDKIVTPYVNSERTATERVNNEQIDNKHLDNESIAFRAKAAQ